MNLFTETNLSPEILKAIGELGYESPTEIQKQTIPFISSDIETLSLWRRRVPEKQQLFPFQFWIW
jgi:superfamily II DNA/RNA helicase